MSTLTKSKLPEWAQPDQVVDLMKLAFPVALSRLSLPIMSVTDAVVLGRMAQLEVPYITIAWLLLSIGMAAGMGVLQGVQVFTAELNASGHYRDTGRVFRRGMWVGCSIGLVSMLAIIMWSRPMYDLLGLQAEVVQGASSAATILAYGMIAHMLVFGATMYLEALRKPVWVTIITYLGVGANVLFDLALVAGWWGFDPMGADGVAWATTGSRAFTAVFLLILVFVYTPGFKKSKPAPKGEFLRQNTVGIGGAIANMAEFATFNLTFVIATLASTMTGMIYSLAIQPIFFSFMLFVGIATATSVRVAESFGRGDAIGVKNASRLGVFAAVLAGVVVTTIIYVLQMPLAIGMASSEEAVTLGTIELLAPVIGVAAFVVMFDGLQVVASSALRAQEKVWIPAAIHIGAYLTVMLPLVYWFTLIKGYGAVGAMSGVAIGSLVVGICQVIFLEWKTARNS
ncbi:MATE family efflux transporter [Hirschia baltica]|uniref:Multi antimicrobial extrusion protein MatE n=1 Tax=Hirschia baltica (strain ATCC 49814 / DSM 5838 / IFAM 1418) TaxID=582402 RepID=C6XK87_HIRBI|nr:MATE family efflux transporter [Hirschia baltica]ACT59532.1 multi antimicrobial extrusion protein MatE [Hirschia baltica ATCC 49814]